MLREAASIHPTRAATNAPSVVKNTVPNRKIICSENTFITHVRLVNGHVDEAWSTGRMLRNMNVLLQGKLDAQGHPQFIAQAHCLCNDGHALAAVRALEALADVQLPQSAKLVRSLVQSLRCIQEHLLHFYQFHLADWASLNAALAANPARTARLTSIPGENTQYFIQTQDRLESFAQGQENTGNHPSYSGSDEFHLLLYAHGLESLKTGNLLNQALALLGCRGEGFPVYKLGGLPEDMDLSAELRNDLRNLLNQCLYFVRDFFLNDLRVLAKAYPEWAQTGHGSTFLSYEEFSHPHKDNSLFPGGITAPKQSNTHGWNTRLLLSNAITETPKPQWHTADHSRYRLHPGTDNADGADGPSFTWAQGDFLWLPVPRHDNDACEVGSLARTLNGWSHGSAEIRQAVTETLDVCALAPSDLNSTLGRVLSRGIESLVLSRAALQWLDALDGTLARDGLTYTPPSLSMSGRGTGRVEVPRGSLTHTIRMEQGRITAHDYLIPSLWNFSPRDANNVRGPLEHALLGTTVAEPDRPLELLRTVHELDPCNTCLLVIEDDDSGKTTVTTAK
jgi:Ni,Fe-hydrogenase I large subunit